MDLDQTKPSDLETPFDLEAQRQLRQDLLRWFDQPLGRSLQAMEARYLRHSLDRLYGTVAIQLGHIGRLNLLSTCNAPTRITLDCIPSASNAPVVACSELLPFESKSVDVAVLPHTLDFADDPHEVLREVYRVLSPEGHVVILGFNPFSIWGLWHFIVKRRAKAPWNGKFLALYRVKDWLALLGFEATQGRMLYYRPPIQKSKFRNRLAFMEKIGDRWWPMGAGVYFIVARKRVVGMTPIQPVWQKRNHVVGGATEPAAKVIYPKIPHWLRRGR